MRRPWDLRRPALATALLAALFTLSCGDGGTSPVGPADPPTQPPVEPPPPPPPVTNPDSTAGTITASGGSVFLSDGTGVVFPAGAVSTSMAVTVRRMPASTYVDVGGEAGSTVLSITAPVTDFSTDVEIRIPLPETATLADSVNVLAGHVDKATGAVEIENATVRIIEGKPFLVSQVRHFSDRFFEWLLGKQPPGTARLEVPYYNQGSSPYCWATSLHMVTQAAAFSDHRLLTEIIGEVGVDEDGITSADFRWSSAISGMVQDRTGMRATRMMWDRVNREQMKNYLWREIGVKGRPVAVHSTKWEHAVVVVGYETSLFYVHDPAAVGTSSLGYKAKSWDAFIKDMELNDKLVTVVVPKDLPTDPELLAINFLPGATEFVVPSSGSGTPSAIWRYGWDYTVPEGYSFRHASSGEVGAPLPGDVTRIQTRGEIQITNASRTRSRTLGVYVDVTALGAPSGTGAYVSTYQDVTVAANSSVNLKVPTMKVDTFRYNKATPTEYALSVIARESGSTVDHQTVLFTLASVTPEITAMAPVEAQIGAEVVLTGTGFGLLPKNNVVTFNGIEVDSVVSWDENEVTVLVPEGATDGPVVLKRGEVPSNEVPFTLAKFSTISGRNTKTYNGSLLAGIVIDEAVDWSFKGVGAKQWTLSEGDTYTRLKADPGEAVELTIDVSGSFDPARYDYPSGYYGLLKEMIWTFNVSPAAATLEESGTGNHRVFKLTPSGSQVCITPRFYILADLYNDKGVLGSKDLKWANGGTSTFCITSG